MILLGISAKAHHGKTTATKLILDSASLCMPDKVHIEIAFASLLKKELASAFGVPVATFYQDATKETPHQGLTLDKCAVEDFVETFAIAAHEVTRREPLTPRLVMQKWADWRLSQDPMYFVAPVAQQVRDLLKWDKCGVVVVSDVRQALEYKCVKTAGGEVWVIHRPSVEPLRFYGRHVSESSVEKICADREIVNGQLDEFQASVRKTAVDFFIENMRLSA